MKKCSWMNCIVFCDVANPIYFQTLDDVCTLILFGVSFPSLCDVMCCGYSWGQLWAWLDVGWVVFWQILLHLIDKFRQNHITDPVLAKTGKRTERQCIRINLHVNPWQEAQASVIRQTSLVCKHSTWPADGSNNAVQWWWAKVISNSKALSSVKMILKCMHVICNMCK